MRPGSLILYFFFWVFFFTPPAGSVLSPTLPEESLSSDLCLMLGCESLHPLSSHQLPDDASGDGNRRGKSGIGREGLESEWQAVEGEHL